MQQLNQIYFFVIVFESQKPPHLNGKWGGERKEGVGKVDGGLWKGCRRCAADRSRHGVSIPAMGAIGLLCEKSSRDEISIPAMGAIV